jgi:glycosyltransferase involved in cell wall biosynthesis
MWSYNRFIHNQCSLTFCPSPSTAAILRLQGFHHLRVWPRGVDTQLFHPGRKSAEIRASWLAAGYLTGEALATAYASADILAFPSHTETFGQVVLEAMASGLPIVGLLSQGVCDLVEDGKTGFLLT